MWRCFVINLISQLTTFIYFNDLHSYITHDKGVEYTYVSTRQVIMKLSKKEGKEIATLFYNSFLLGRQVLYKSSTTLTKTFFGVIE